MQGIVLELVLRWFGVDLDGFVVGFAVFLGSTFVKKPLQGARPCKELRKGASYKEVLMRGAILPPYSVGSSY